MALRCALPLLLLLLLLRFSFSGADKLLVAFAAFDAPARSDDNLLLPLLLLSITLTCRQVAASKLRMTQLAAASKIIEL